MTIHQLKTQVAPCNDCGAPTRIEAGIWDPLDIVFVICDRCEISSLESAVVHDHANNVGGSTLDMLERCGVPLRLVQGGRE